MHQARAKSTRPPQASLAVRGSAAGAGSGREAAPCTAEATGSGAANTGLRSTGRNSPAFSVTMGLAAGSRRTAAGRGGALAAPDAAGVGREVPGSSPEAAGGGAAASDATEAAGVAITTAEAAGSTALAGTAGAGPRSCMMKAPSKATPVRPAATRAGRCQAGRPALPRAGTSSVAACGSSNCDGRACTVSANSRSSGSATARGR